MKIAEGVEEIRGAGYWLEPFGETQVLLGHAETPEKPRPAPLRPKLERFLAENQSAINAWLRLHADPRDPRGLHDAPADGPKLDRKKSHLRIAKDEAE